MGSEFFNAANKQLSTFMKEYALCEEQIRRIIKSLESHGYFTRIDLRISSYVEDEGSGFFVVRVNNYDKNHKVVDRLRSDRDFLLMQVLFLEDFTLYYNVIDATYVAGLLEPILNASLFDCLAEAVHYFEAMCGNWKHPTQPIKLVPNAKSNKREA